MKVIMMRDLDKALVDIELIRSHMAAGTMFRGLGPGVIAISGVLAALLAFVQGLQPEILTHDPYIYLACWVALAIFAAGLIGVEMVARSRRHHKGLATVMILKAIEYFLPSAVAGASVAAVMVKYAPQALWIMPGIWQVLVAIGLFAAAASLPREIKWVGAWYFVAGIAVLILASQTHELSPWFMGAPFAIGQLFMAFVLYKANQEMDKKDEQ